MTPDEYRAALEALGLSRARLGRLLLADKATPSNWAVGHYPVPRAVVLLLRAMVAGHLTIEQLESL